MAWYLYLAVIAAGFSGGFINTLAGSGSLITLPVLIFLGLPANVANGTNRVGILLQNIIGASSFRRHGVLDLRGALILAIPAIVGSLVGAQIAVNLNEELLRRTIGVLMVAMLAVIAVRPQRWLQGRLDRLEGVPSAQQLLVMFLIGIYGGFIQAGVGIFLLAALVLGIGYDLVRANAVKVTINLAFTISSLVVFAGNSQVAWGLGLILGMGNMLGAWTATRVAVEKGNVWVRRLLMAVVTVAAVHLLGVGELLLRIF